MFHLTNFSFIITMLIVGKSGWGKSVWGKSVWGA
jgi:ABC-type dipeptide/oligopeptide/nickel transport system ATPase component